MSRLWLQRGAPAPAPAPIAQRARAGLGGGRPLDGATRATMERGFGQDLGGVRVHAGPAATRAARGLGAAAYTIGEDIVLGGAAARRGLAGGEGRALLSHELAHVVQQRAGGGAPPGARHEAAADAAAAALAAGRAAGPQPAAAPGVQRRVELRDVGRGEHSGMARLGELIARLNAISTALIFHVDDGALAYTENPYGDMTEFDRQLRDFIDSDTIIPLRITNQHGLAPDESHGPNLLVNVDNYRHGYVDIDDLLNLDDLTFRAALIHLLTERFRTPQYARRLGMLDNLGADFDRAHGHGLRAELAVLRDYFEDDTIRPVDLEARLFRNGRGDRIRLRVAAPSAVSRHRYEVVLRDGTVMTAEAYRALRRRERAAAPAAPAAAPAAVAGGAP